ncbi:MAG: ferrous iron transport protein A [bacterium]|nr:ferrous iron transport protein A [bacterium]
MNAISLCLAPLGKKYQIVELRAEGRLQERLRGMGFGRGRLVEVVMDRKGKPLVVGFPGSGQRVACAREVAEHVMVRKWSEEAQ